MIIYNLTEYFRRRKIEKIRNEFDRLINPQTVQDELDSYYAKVNVAVKLFEVMGKKQYDNQMDQEANIANQFLFTKCLGILKLYGGVSFKGLSELKKFIDPYQMVPLIRTQFETFGMFNHIYRCLEEEQKLFRYNLWVICGLLDRQRFKDSVSNPDHLSKLREEKEILDNLIGEINNLSIVKALTVNEQKKLRNLIKRREWKVGIDKGKTSIYSWFQLAKNAGTNDKLDKMYALFSTDTHPSNPAIFRFRDSFESNQNVTLATNYMNFSGILLTLHLCDFINYFPSLVIIFNALPIEYQLLLNELNVAFRSDEFRINSIHEDIFNSLQ